MYGDRTAETQRKQRQEENVELRRVRTEELLKKKREALESTTNVVYAASRQKLESYQPEDIYNGAYEFRLVLSQENNPPIQAVIDSGIVNRVVDLLEPSFYVNAGIALERANAIRIECAWILTNICTGTHEQTRVVARTRAPMLLVEMLCEEDHGVVDQSVWCLGNIAGDCEEFRDALIQMDVVEKTIHKINKYGTDQLNIKILRNLLWLLSNLNRGRNPSPEKENMQKSLLVFEQFCLSQDAETVSTCFWGISYICDSDEELTTYILNSVMFRKMYELLSSFTQYLQTQRGTKSIQTTICISAISPLIRTVGNIVSGSDEQTEIVIKSGIIEMLPVIFYNFGSKKIARIRKEICWTLSNISAGTVNQVRHLFDRRFISMLIDAISKYEIFIRKEAIYALVSISAFASSQNQTNELLDLGIIKGLKKCIESCANYPDVLVQTLEVCANLFDGGEEMLKRTGVNRVHEEMVNSKLADMIEDLQDVRSNVVASKAYDIIIKYFNGEDEDVY
ncbi:IMA2 [Enterospora canceri]|uniref:Importin subunit alpha n=1 Tax=Enterospora canceri TaxID=1081671 RepID=A0A1Y1S942_9MICR|nr:IMA2 [Enterospora canceri]